MKSLLIASIAGFLTCVGVRAEEPSGSCTLVKRERIYEFFGQLRSQTVFRDRQMVGWRIYAPEDAQQGLGLRPMDLVTHICGVAAGELVKGDDDICCGSDVQDAIPLRVERDGKPMNVSARLAPNQAKAPPR